MSWMEQPSFENKYLLLKEVTQPRNYAIHILEPLHTTHTLTARAKRTSISGTSKIVGGIFLTNRVGQITEIDTNRLLPPKAYPTQFDSGRGIKDRKRDERDPERNRERGLWDPERRYSLSYTFLLSPFLSPSLSFPLPLLIFFSLLRKKKKLFAYMLVA